MRRLSLAMLVMVSLLPPAPGPALAATTPCDGRPDSEIPADAHIGDFSSVRFMADVDGDGLRDVITGYWLGTDPDLGEHYLHVELASGWGTQIRTDTFPDVGHPMSSPRQVVVMEGQRLLVSAIQRGANFADMVFFAFEDCALQPTLLAGGGIPPVSDGGGFTHREWFTCREDGVVMIETQYRLDENFDVDQEVFEIGGATFFRFDPGGFFVEEGPVALNLPRPVTDVFADFPVCPPYMGTFSDDDHSQFQFAIEWMLFEGHTTGCNRAVTRYCPRDSLTRGEMAAFLVRALGYTDNGGGDLFVDDDDSIFDGDLYA